MYVVVHLRLRDVGTRHADGSDERDLKHPASARTSVWRPEVPGNSKDLIEKQRSSSSNADAKREHGTHKSLSPESIFDDKKSKGSR